MELKQLRALQAIAETGSFVLAAERLGLTQSALSHQIRNLEEEFEETMLVRARPHVYPTSVGAAVLESAKTIIEEMVKLEARFLGSKKGPMPGTLRLAVSNMSLIYVLADICEVFIARHPEIELVIRATETTEEALRRVLIGTADLAFSPFLSKQEQLTRLMLGSTEHAFIVAPSHPLGDRKTVSLQDLQ
jgi:LysR family transcriptional regulator, regulator for metE and metH